MAAKKLPNAPRKSGVSRRTPKRAASALPPPQVPAPRDFAEYELADEAIEQALLSDDHGGLLEDYFGAESYQELRQLAREANSRGVRGGPKVLILPGIMGSKIGIKGKIGIFDDTYWFDPVDVALGRLDALSLPDDGKLQAIGVLLISYLKLKLRLKIAGYDAQFHPFDWRKSIAEMGKILKQRIADEGGDQVSLVAHSMGGLVARWALGDGAKCRRLIMLGTPNHGSFAPVMALRGAYPVVAKLGWLDRKHRPNSATWLAKNVFSTFPGLIQMFPTPQVFSNLDLYDLANWPDDGLSPRKEALAGAQKVQKAMVDGGENLFLIAGVNQDTIIGLRRIEGVKVKDKDKVKVEYEYESAKAGDGTVPLAFCQLPAIADRTYYVEESHGSLPNNTLVGSAVIELLDRGRTSLLSQQALAPRAGGVWITESRLRMDFLEVRGEVPLGRRELRTVLDEVASAGARQMTVPVTAEMPFSEQDNDFRHTFDQVVVGRRKQHRLEIRLARGSITEVDTRAIALGIFRDVAQRGAALALDRRLGGAITDLTRRRMFSGDVGEVFMMPSGRHPLGADLIAFVGLGSFDRFNDEVLQTAAENILRMFVQTRVEEFACVVFGGGSGSNPARALRNLLSGFVRGLLDADRDHSFRRVVICERSDVTYDVIKRELYRLASTALCEGVEITFDERKLPSEMVVPGDAVARHLTPGPEPSYLIVRAEGRSEAQTPGGSGKLDVRSSLLTAGGKATVVTGVQEIKRSDLDRVIQAAVNEQADFSKAGQELASLLLAKEVLELLSRSCRDHLVVVHDALLSRVPWETIALPLDLQNSPNTDDSADGLGIRDELWFPAAGQGLSRRYAADNLSVAKWLEKRVAAANLQVLLVVNPTGDLPGAAEEGALVEAKLKEWPGIRLDKLTGDEATRPALLRAISSAQYDVLHYAGHAFFDEQSPERSGLLCAGRQPLSGLDLVGLGNLPSLVFFNACESAKVRSAGKQKRGSGGSPEQRTRNLKNSVGLAEAFMRGGVANLIGTYWPVGDISAKTFAEQFYLELLRGKTIGQAMITARQALVKLPTNDWADYILYGDANFVVKAG